MSENVFDFTNVAKFSFIYLAVHSEPIPKLSAVCFTNAEYFQYLTGGYGCNDTWRECMVP